MPDTSRFDALKFISEQHRTLHDQRRRYEMKIVLTTISFYVLNVAALLSDKVSLPTGQPVKWAVWCCFLGLAGLTTTYLRQVHKANSYNKKMAEAAEGCLVSDLGDDALKSQYETMPGTPVRPDWAWRWQAATIILFAAISAACITYLLDHPTKKPNQASEATSEPARGAASSAPQG
jgi:hypothetical protein